MGSDEERVVIWDAGIGGYLRRGADGNGAGRTSDLGYAGTWTREEAEHLVSTVDPVRGLALRPAPDALVRGVLDALHAVRRVVDRDLDALADGHADPAYLTTVLASCEGFRLARERADTTAPLAPENMS